MGEYVEQWLAAKAGLRSNTRRSYRGHLDRYLKPVLGHLRLTELRHVHVERAHAALPLVGRDLDGDRPDELLRILAVRDSKLPLRPMGAASIRRVHATLMSALNTAVKERLLAANPAAHAELPTARRPKPVVWTPERIAVWTPEQTGRFRDAAVSHRYYAPFHLIAFRGLRRVEAVDIRWEDVDLDARTLTVTQQVVQLGWETEVGVPKTESGSRMVTLDGASTAALRAWREVQDGEARLLGAGCTTCGTPQPAS